MLTGHLLTFFFFYPKHPLSYLPLPCVAGGICSARMWSLRPLLPLSISFMHSLVHCCQGDDWQRQGRWCKCARLSRQRFTRVPVQTRPKRSQINPSASWVLEDACTKGCRQATTASKNWALCVPPWKEKYKIIRKYSWQVDSSRLQPLFFSLCSSIMSEEWDSGVRNPFPLMD